MIKKGNWICNPLAKGNNTYVNFVREFELSEVVSDAELFICADTEYALWINGSFVDCGQYKDYPSHLCYDTFCVEKYLTKGKNTLTIKVYYQGCESFQYSKGDAGLWFMLKNGNTVIESDKNVLTSVAKEYESGEIFTTTMQLGYGFLCDARKETVDSLIPVEEKGEKCFYPRPVKKLVHSEKKNTKIIAQGYLLREEEKETPAKTMHIDYLSHRNFNDVFEGNAVMPGKIRALSGKDIYFLIDLEEERGGYLTFELEASEGTVVDIAYGEHLNDLRVRSSIAKRNFANRYICKDGKQSFTHYYKRIACRYIEVHITNFSYLTVYNMGIIRTDYPLNHSGEFSSCDSLHNKIHDVCKETLACCMHEHYEDTPWREQALYASDSRNQMLFGYYTFSEYQMAKSSLQLLARGMKADAFIPMCAPSDSDICIPSFSFIWLLAMKEYMAYSDDASLAESLWEQLEYMLETYTKDMKNNLAKRPYGKRYWHYYEWSDGNVFDEPFAEPASPDFEENYLDGLYNAFLCIAIDSALYMGERLRKDDFCKKYSKILKNIRNAINTNFWNEELSVYCSCVEYGKKKNYSELMQSVAILCGAADDNRADILRKTLADNENSLVKITLSYTLYKYEALLNKNDTYLKTVLDEIAERWGKMLFSNAVTVWELEKDDKMFGPAGSFCHGWSAVPIYVYYRYVLGISAEFMCGKTDIAENYKSFPVCKGSVATLGGKKTVERINI